MIALLLAAAATVAASRPAPIPLEQYRTRLLKVDGLLARGARTEAAKEAGALLDQPIETPDGPIAPDRAALGPIADPSLPPHRARLQLLLRSLGESTSRESAREAASPAPDLSALEALRAARESKVLIKGGQFTPLAVDVESFWNVWGDSIARAFEWASKQFGKLLDWLRDSFRGGGEKEAIESSSRTNIFIFIATGFVLAMVLLLALRARLSKRELVPIPAPTRKSVAEDEDPLSRGVSEWEARALELAAAGRAREAIRAWYHALLVACYRTGLLHHRRGRTNWEYAAALSPEMPWRPRFLELTRWFDEQWYGRRESSEEALALFADDATRILRVLRERAR